MILGAAYYPEHWPKERWALDAKLMQEAGFNVVRMAEFAWSMIERREGEFSFDWLDEAIELFVKHDIKTILGTPTATPPKWLMDKHPSIYGQDINGKRLRFGGRRHYCHSNAEYRQYIKIITTKMAEHYGDNPHVIAWQVDNELGGDHNARCYCESCKEGFRKYLRAKYQDVDALNAAWGTSVWSQIYNDFDEIDSPDVTHALPNPSTALDYFRYCSDTIVDYQDFQINILRQHTKDQLITTNLFGVFTEIDYHKLTQSLDVVSTDFYPNLTLVKPAQHKQAMAIDVNLTHGEKPLWRMEQQSGMPGGHFMFPAPKEGDIARWAYQSVAHGADGIVFFRWRTNVCGAEQHWHGILGHDGVPRTRYNEVKEFGKQIKKIETYLAGTSRAARVAIVHDYENDWVFEIQPHALDFVHMEHIEHYYKAFFDAGVAVDIVSPDTDYACYDLLIFPNSSLVDDARVQKVYRYVDGGGHVLFDFRSGVRDQHNRILPMVPPGPLGELLGIEVLDYGIVGDYEDVCVVTEDGQRGACGTWFEQIKEKSAQVKAHYEGERCNALPAVTCNQHGKGSAWYLGTILDDAMMSWLISSLCRQTRIESRWPACPEGVEAVCREDGSKKVMFLMNHNDKEQTVYLDDTSWQDIIIDEPVVQSVLLKVREVKVFLSEG